MTIRHTFSAGLLVAIATAFSAPSAVAQLPAQRRFLSLHDFNCYQTTGTRVFENIIWDGWTGSLTLRHPDTGTLSSNGQSYAVRYTAARQPHDWIDGMRGPGITDWDGPSWYNNRIVMWVDFNRTPSNQADDQRFDGYMSNANPGHEYFRNHIAGVAWWNGLPFGFFTRGTSTCQ